MRTTIGITNDCDRTDISNISTEWQFSNLQISFWDGQSSRRNQKHLQAHHIKELLVQNMGFHKLEIILWISSRLTPLDKCIFIGGFNIDNCLKLTSKL